MHPIVFAKERHYASRYSVIGVNNVEQNNRAQAVKSCNSVKGIAGFLGHLREEK
jgi:hypothetical protein